MRQVALIAACLIMGACAAPETSPPGTHSVAPANRDCFNVSMVTGYDAVDRDTIRVRMSAAEQYDIDVEGVQCNTLEWAHRLAIESTPSPWVCIGNQPGQGEIHFRDPTTSRRISCYITDVRRVVLAGS